MEEQLRASSLWPCKEGARAQEMQEWTPHVNDSTHFQIFFQPNVKLEWTEPFQPNKRWVQPIPHRPQTKHPEAKGSAGGILIGANTDIFLVCDIMNFSGSVMLSNKSNGFAWKLVVLYGPPPPMRIRSKAFLISQMQCWDRGKVPYLFKEILILLHQPSKRRY
jgi:hypothetical protein